MFWLILAVLAGWLLYWASHYQRRWLNVGKPIFARRLTLGDQAFYAEESSFADWHTALHHYMKLVPELEQLGQVQEVRFDYMDFSHSIYRFADFTLYLQRRVDKIRLIKSHTAMPIAEFEQALPAIHRCLPD